MKRLIFIFLMSLLLLAGKAQAEGEPAIIRGTVTDDDLNPLSGVAVKLVSEDTAIDCTVITHPNGQFTLKHQPCKLCYLEVCPRKDSHLATAWIDNINGEENRRVVIELHKGYQIKGRVVHANKGLKGLTVTMNALEEGSHRHACAHAQQLVHGGGRAVTNGRGVFTMTLTPGLKCLTIANSKYSGLIDSFAHKVSITEDAIIADIELPECRLDKSQSTP